MDESEPIQSYYWIPTVEDLQLLLEPLNRKYRGTGNSSGRSQNVRGGVVRQMAVQAEVTKGEVNQEADRQEVGPARPPIIQWKNIVINRFARVQDKENDELPANQSTKNF